MTQSDHKKVLVQLKVKPGKLKKYTKHNVPKPRKHGMDTKHCVRCGNTKGHISKYGLGLCRQCFRDIATKIGFKKYS
ncbi:30S ribosomal protein S14 [Nanoarchaeota archaeon]